MGRHETGQQAVEWHESGAMLWSRRIALIAGGAGALILAAGIGLWIAFPQVRAAQLPSAVGAVVLFVAVAGRISTVASLRYADRALPQPPTVADPMHHSGRRRRSARRRSTIAYLGMGIGAIWLLVAWGTWSSEPIEISAWPVSIGVAILLACYLAGPAARFVVTPQHLHIDTAFVRTSVPRAVIAGLTGRFTELRLDLTTGGHVDFRVDSPLWDIRNSGERSNERCLYLTADRIVTMLREVPPVGATGTVSIRIRRGVVTLTALATAAALPLLVIGTVAILKS
jgi:hypothetical protein